MFTDKANPAGPVSENIYQALRRQILTFELAPGDSLSENALATQLQVSRAPVRSAMAQLAEEGYVTVYPQRGTAVSMIDSARVQQSIFLRMTLEQSVVETLSRQTLCADQLQLLDACLARQGQLLEDSKVDQMIEEDEILHALFFAFSGHPEVQEVFRTLEVDQLRVRYLQLKTFSYSRRVQLTAMAGWENYLLEHRMLVDAVKKQDTEAACLMAANHINGILWHTDNMQKIYPHYFQVGSS